MKRFCKLFLLLFVTFYYSTAQQLTQTAPNGVFTAQDIQYWIGEGDKEAAFVLVFNDGFEGAGNALVWGYRWEGSVTFWQMIENIAAADPRFFAMSGINTGTIGGFGVDVNEDGIFSIHNTYSGNTILPNESNIFWVDGYDYDDWISVDDNDRWAGGWGTGFWFITTMYSQEVDPNVWHGASFNDFTGTFPLAEDLSTATYQAVLPPNTPSECNAPTQLAATVVLTSVHLTWESIPSALHYTIIRNTDTIATQLTDLQYDDTYLLSGNYSYSVMSVCAAGETAVSLPVEVSISAPFAPPVGQEGTTAIPNTSELFVAWAKGIQLTRGFTDIANPTQVVSFAYPAKALGPAEGNSMDVVSLGDAGEAIVTFDRPIINGEGADFAVFENSFDDGFLELAFVEVSSDGHRFVRFPAYSLTPTDVQVGGFGSVDATMIHNLAGKYRQGYGTPFDLEDLIDSTGIDLNNIRFVKVIDAIGTIDPNFASFDCQGHIVNDPYPTNFASGGFDLDGVGIINAGVPYVISDFNDLTLSDNSYWNGSTGEGSFESGIVTYINDYDLQYYSWSGFAYSNTTDNTTPGYTNQFSAYTQGGMDANPTGTNYGVGYMITDWMSGTYDPVPLTANFENNEAHVVNGFYATNSTYAYLSMLNGDSFAKKFGGTSGNDPDWYKLMIFGIDADDNPTDTIEFYLADFRFSDNTKDYIVANWRWVELSSLGAVKSLNFFVLSTDSGNYGINTPAYFCIDNMSIQLDGNIDHAPEVVNPIADVIVEFNAGDYSVNLENVFSDPDGDEISISISSNSNPTLVTPTLVNDLLTLTFAQNNSGVSEIVVTATANELSVSDTIMVTVLPNEDVPPVVANPIADVTVEYNTPEYIIDLTNVFSDANGDEIVKTVQSNSNEALVNTVIAGNTLTLTFAENESGAADIVILATANGLTVTDAFVATVLPAPDQPPVVVNPIEDITVTENAADYPIDLSNVFSDPDGDELTFSVLANSNPELMSTTISGNIFTLSFAPDMNGFATIVIQAAANGLTATDAFLVTVTESEDLPPMVVNPIDDVEVDENSENITIDLSDVFSDPDGDVITISVAENSNEALITTTITDQTLTLAFTQNQYGEANIVLKAQSNALSVTDAFTVTVNHIYNIVNTESFSCNLYPNPATNFITIETDDEHQSVELFDMSGNMVLNSRQHAVYQNINISTLPIGSYLVRIQMNGKMITKVIIKQ